jgi:hypothetical protein
MPSVCLVAVVARRNSNIEVRINLADALIDLLINFKPSSSFCAAPVGAWGFFKVFVV